MMWSTFKYVKYDIIFLSNGYNGNLVTMIHDSVLKDSVFKYLKIVIIASGYFNH